MTEETEEEMTGVIMTEVMATGVTEEVVAVEVETRGGGGGRQRWRWKKISKISDQ